MIEFLYSFLNVSKFYSSSRFFIDFYYIFSYSSSFFYIAVCKYINTPTFLITATSRLAYYSSTLFIYIWFKTNYYSFLLISSSLLFNDYLILILSFCYCSIVESISCYYFILMLWSGPPFTFLKCSNKAIFNFCYLVKFYWILSNLSYSYSIS